MANYEKCVAYFTMEAGITHLFKNYSGGLGILSGDHVKQAADDNANTYFFSILWKKGYNLQKVLDDGTVVDVPQDNENWAKFVEYTGKKFILPVENKELLVKIWKYKGLNLYLLDCDLEENGDWHRLTYNLYGGAYPNAEFERVVQEMILGIGGIYAIKELGIDPEFYHFNDGHAIFAVHKLIYDYMKEYSVSFEVALNALKSKIRFTTHTNVKDGNELHDINTLIQFGANYNLSYNQLQALGSNDHYGGSNNYGMTIAALNSSGKVNGVSVLHAKEANKLWSNVQNKPEIFAITNGVHRPTWQKEDIYEYAKEDNKDMVWNMHMKYKANLINYVYAKTGVKLDINSLTIGFARRATGYKRWDLIFKNPLSIEDLIKRYNIQLIFAGKSHQKDFHGKKYLSIIKKFSKEYPNNVLFLEGYDIDMASYLTSGCDIWLNTPLVPMEACGTSGMKAALNGVLNFSSSDGWWAEACKHEENGWEIYSHENLSGYERDRKDAESLIYYLYTSVVPTYYNEDKTAWINMMINSIKMADYFTTERMLKDYYEKLYI